MKEIKAQRSTQSFFASCTSKYGQKFLLSLLCHSSFDPDLWYNNIQSPPPLSLYLSLPNVYLSLTMINTWDSFITMVQKSCPTKCYATKKISEERFDEGGVSKKNHVGHAGNPLESLTPTPLCNRLPPPIGRSGSSIHSVFSSSLKILWQRRRQHLIWKTRQQCVESLSFEHLAQGKKKKKRCWVYLDKWQTCY